MQLKKLSLNIATTYCPTWTPAMALRELIANAIDGGDWSINHVTDAISLTNAGLLKPSHFVMGISEKDSSNAIGQFGEGMKVGLMVLLRENFGIKITSYTAEVDYHYVPTIEDSLLGVPTLCLRASDKAPITIPKTPFTQIVITHDNRDTLANLFHETSNQWLVQSEYTKMPRIAIENDVIYVSEDITITQPKDTESAISLKTISVGGFVIARLELAFNYDFRPGTLKMNRDRASFDIWQFSDLLLEMLETDLMEGRFPPELLRFYWDNIEDIRTEFVSMSQWGREFSVLAEHFGNLADQDSKGEALVDSRSGSREGYVISDYKANLVRGGSYGSFNQGKFIAPKLTLRQALTEYLEFAVIPDDVRTHLEAILSNH